ncbi:LysM peptidoglycan-binding domain-containing protein [Flavobacterium sp.]|uniref:PBP1 and LysM peptidoglycan-binding domain-containing protein n=1 Tax=Flavobacterium sp. TaxID=239 RepID=UPI0037537317
MLKKIFSILFLIITSFVSAQSYIKHTVNTDETIQTIAKKYKVTPFDIYKLNPDAQNGIQITDVLLIPKSIVKEDNVEVKPKETTPNKPKEVVVVKPKEAVIPKLIAKTHTVVAKESLYSISKKYNISIESLKNFNPSLKTDNLQLGQILLVSGKPVPEKLTEKKIIEKVEKKSEVKVEKTVEVKKSIATFTHEVQPKETKYGIATKYGISVEELEKLNPEILENLPIGFKLKIVKNGFKPEIVKDIKVQTTNPKAEVVPIKTINFLVQSGETIYSLTRKFNTSEATLLALNPDLKDGVKEGMTLKVPANTSITNEFKSEFKDFTKSISTKNKKKLVLFLPFNVSKIQSDSLTSIGERLKKDKFLNMTLDFYSGAIMAIDSAKVLGLNLDIQILDSEETKNSTSALSQIQTNDFSDTNAIIGPFYQVNIEKIASELESKNIPVISPLSKDEGKSYANLYQSMPQNDAIKNAMFSYMREKNGNIISFVDPKKPLIKQYILDYQKDVKIAGLSEKGGFVADSIKKYFVKDKLNFVVMATERTETIITITNVLANAMKEYQIQLVLLEANDNIDFDEIPLSRLTKLKLTYPSLTKENTSGEAKKFERAYKKKNKVFPNQYATRGFDLTLDTMLRLSQEKTFEETCNTIATEQVENKFEYSKKLSGGYANNGCYILFYDTDLTIKTAQ